MHTGHITHGSFRPTCPFLRPDFSLAVFDFVNALYGAAEGWDVSTTHAQQRSERGFGFLWHAIKGVHEYQNEGPDDEAFGKAGERLEESVFENGRAADTCLTRLWDGYVLAACGE